MRVNENAAIFGNNVVLVPYKQHHVEKYHNWMQSPDLQKLTASDPLSLDEEYSMQQKWLEDIDKCCFIILDKSEYDATKNEVLSMIGDINLFILNTEKKTAECGIMIAEPNYRGKRRGWEAMLLLLKYGIQYLDIEYFQAKIGYDNEPSLHLFEKLKFSCVSNCKIFKEFTYQVKVMDKWILWVNNNILKYELLQYDLSKK